MKNTKIIAVAIQKGGVGKTFFTTNAAYLLAENSYTEKGKVIPRKPLSVTALDLDPQCNLTHSLLIRDVDVQIDYSEEETTAALLGWRESNDWDFKQPMPSAISVEPVFGSFYEGLIKCVPAHPLALADLDQMDMEDILQAAQRIRDFAEQSEDDVILIDCSPQLGVRQLVAMLAADHIISPINLDVYSETGLYSLLSTYVAIQDSNEDCELHVVPNKVDLKTKANGEILEDIQEKYGEFVTKSYIPYTTSIGAATKSGRPLWRKCPSGNDAAVGKKVRAAISETLALCDINAK